MDNISDLKNRKNDLSLPKPNTNFGKRCFKYNGAVVWITVQGKSSRIFLFF